MNPKAMNFEAVAVQIAKLELRSGDALVLKTHQHLTIEQVEHIKKDLTRILPNTPILVLDKDFDLTVVRKELTEIHG